MKKINGLTEGSMRGAIKKRSTKKPNAPPPPIPKKEETINVVIINK